MTIPSPSPDVAARGVGPLTAARRADEPAVLVCLAVIVLGALWAGVLAGPDAPGDRSADAGFARDMAAHHEQAVAMAEAIRARSPAEDVAVLATDIALTQQAQIGRMRGWLDTWGLAPTGRDLPMAWMGHPTGGLMPGMARRADIAALSDGATADAEVAFLRLMIRHHQGGVSMAQGALARARTGEVRSLAEGIVSAQRSEITLMSQMLQARGAAPPSDVPHMPAMDVAKDAVAVWRATARVAPVAAALLAAAWLVADGAWRGRLWAGPVRRRPLQPRWPALLLPAAALAAAGAVHLGVVAADVPVGVAWLYVVAAIVELSLAAVAAAWPLPAARTAVTALALAVFAVTLGAGVLGPDNPPATVLLAIGAAQVLAVAATAGTAVAAQRGEP